MDNPIVSFKDVHMEFGNVKALQGVNYTMNKGNIYGILGHNGAGKTTTLRLIIGLLKPTKGSVSVFGLNPLINSIDIKSKVGMLTEDVGLYENLTAYENLIFFGRLYKIPEKRLVSRIKYLLNELKLSEKQNVKVKEFSKGMKKKLAIIRTMLHNPQLLLLDEPSNGLDPVSTNTLHEEIQKLVSNEKVSVILSTHNLEEAKKLCDVVTIIKQGKNIISIDLKNQNKSEVWFKITCLEQLNSFNSEIENFIEKLHSVVVDYDISGDTLEIRVNKKENIRPIIQNLLDLGITIYKIIPQEYDLQKIYLAVHEEVNHLERSN